MKLTSSAQEARCIAWTPQPSSAGGSRASSAKNQWGEKLAKDSVACRPPFATAKDTPARPTQLKATQRERLDPTQLDRFAGLDSYELFQLEYEPKGMKVIPREGSHVFGSPTPIRDDQERQYKTVESWRATPAASEGKKSRLKSSAQPARVLMTPNSSYLEKPKPLAIQPPYATEDKKPKLPTKKIPERLAAEKQPRVAGLDSISLFYISGPRGVKPLPRPGSNIFGNPEACGDEVKEQQKMLWKTTYSSFDGTRGEPPKDCTTWLWHPYNRPFMAPYAPDKPGEPELEKEQPFKPVAGLNSAELSAVQDIPMPRGVKRIPLPDSNIFGVDPNEPFHTGQEVGFRFPSMVQVGMLERQLKPHKPKSDKKCPGCGSSSGSSMHHSHSAPDIQQRHHHRKHRGHKGADKFGQTF